MFRPSALRIAAGLTLLAAGTLPAAAGDLTRTQSDLFETHIRPTFIAQCIKCHGASKQESDLRLDTREALLKGGAAGPAIVPGKPDESLLLEALRYESYEMPPAGQLEEPVIEGIAAWIAAGAPWPEGVVLAPTPQITAEDRDWWCYQPIADPAVPTVEDGGWCRNEIDRFIFARLAKEGLHPAEEADPATLERRVSYALTGLPPAQGAADVRGASQSDPSDYETLVDQLLASPAYGENQARLWLDLVRYADSDGYRADGARPHAWRYRDYVIRSFNADKPYDRFVTEQLAGDEIDPGNEDALVATMFLRHWIYEHNQRDVEGQWAQILNDITETTADVFIAQGVKCARCHDHKFDPILQKDYYRFQAFFAAFQPREDQPVANLARRTEHFEKQRAWEAATEDLRRRLYAIEMPALHAHTTGEGIDKFVDEIRSLIEKRVIDRTPYEHQIAELASRQFKVHPDKLPEWLDKETEAERQRLLKELAAFDHLKPEPLPTIAFVASDVGPVAPPTVIPGDDSQTPIAPGFLTILDEAPATITPPAEALQSTGRRTALANWITDPKNPFTARVLVNRVWQQHFGHGLVASSSDFGRLGAPPSHPELLDWLATRFVEDGWSLKKLHRRILTSATWRQSSRRPMTDEIATIDPGNQLLWRMNPYRLSGEEIRDTILAASGELAAEKRSVLLPVKRNGLNPLLVAFDFPDRITSASERHRTTTSTQALVLANNAWSHERAGVLARRCAAGQSDDAAAFVAAAYESLFSRRPTPEETALATQFLAEYVAATPTEPPQPPAELVRMPATGGQAIDLRPDGQFQIGLGASKQLPTADFTVEAVVLLRSLYEDASVRTIAANWSGSNTEQGWSFGVTSTKSSFTPRNLILQLVGRTGQGEAFHYEVIPSGLRPELNKPYYVAVSVNLADTSEQGVTFLMKDLSKPDAAVQTARVPHTVTRDVHPSREVHIGGRGVAHRWDGLMDSIRIQTAASVLRPVALIDAAAPAAEESSNRPTADVADLRFENPDQLGLDSSPADNHAWTKSQRPAAATPRERARTAFVHALLNSNELIYID